MNKIDFTWNLLFRHIFKSGTKGFSIDEESYFTLYEDGDFSIGWWIGTPDFQWVELDHGANIVNYPYGMEELDKVRQKWSNMTDEEFDMFCDIMSCLTNVDNYISYENECSM